MIKTATKAIKENKLPLLAVKSSITVGHNKKVLLEGASNSQAPLLLPRFSLIGIGDKLELKEGLERYAWIVDKNNEVRTQLLPSFETHGIFALAGHNIKTRIAEITTANEYTEYQNLSDFHYKGLDFSSGDLPKRKKSMGGRKGILLLQLQLSESWQTVGYIELQMPLMMAKPRHIAFSRPFNHPSLNIKWDKWEKRGQALVNHIVRISRIVIHPEFRGAGLSRLLVRNAIIFAKDRWHIGGKKALFIEISAEMLKHIDFVSPCGFHYLGDTQGNKSRLVKDMESMAKGQKKASGIMSLQRKYYTLFENYRKSTGETFEALQARLSEILTSSNPWLGMTLDEWLALRPVIRTPIPYYMIGLDEYSDNYVKAAAVHKIKEKSLNHTNPISEIKFDNIHLQSNFEIKPTTHSRMIMDSFGITAKNLRNTIVNLTDFSVNAGTITFIAGSSGTGKSMLLSRVDPHWKSKTIICEGRLVPSSYKVEWLKPLPEDSPLFEYLANKYGSERTFDVLARVGLSEALLFLKPFSLLSRGQRYRAMLAKLMLGNADVWLIDEFCSDLDPLSASLVSYRFRQTVLTEKRIAFVAAANHRHFIHSLQPTQIVVLKTGGNCEILKWKDYSNGLSKQVI